MDLPSDILSCLFEYLHPREWLTASIGLGKTATENLLHAAEHYVFSRLGTLEWNPLFQRDMAGIGIIWVNMKEYFWFDDLDGWTVHLALVLGIVTTVIIDDYDHDMTNADLEWVRYWCGSRTVEQYLMKKEDQ